MPSISFFLFQQARVVVRCMFTRRLVHLYRSLSGMTTQHRDQAAGKNAVATVKRLNQRSSVNDNGSSEENPRRAASLRAFDRDLDSSESIPSDHSSLYDAARTSSELEEDACYDGGPRREVRVEQAADIPLAVLPASASKTSGQTPTPSGAELHKAHLCPRSSSCYTWQSYYKKTPVISLDMPTTFASSGQAGH